MRILFKIPSRSRPEVFEETMRVWIGHQRTQSVTYLITVDEDDDRLKDYEMAFHRLARLPNMREALHCTPGRSSSKIHAVNRDMHMIRDWDVLVLGSDDMRCRMPGWDHEIITRMEQLYPNLDGAPHYPDGNRTDLITFSIMGRRLYDAFGYIYHPDYKSLWADNEFHDSVTALGRTCMVRTNLVRHVHPSIPGGLATDALYQRNEALFNADKAVYERRRRHNFDVERVRAALGS